MRTSFTLSALLPLALTLANPVPAPVPADLPVSIANAALPAASKIPNSYIIVYKSSAAASQINGFSSEILTKLGQKPKSQFNINGFKAANVITDAAGLAKIAKSDLVRIYYILHPPNAYPQVFESARSACQPYPVPMYRPYPS